VVVVVTLIGIITYIQFIDKDVIDTKNNNTVNNMISNDNGSTNSNKNTNKSIEIALNEKVTIEDVCEIVIENISFSKRVDAPNTDGYFNSYYEVKNSDNTYIVIKGNIKNISNSRKYFSDVLDANIKYDNKYEYILFSTFETEDSSGFSGQEGIDALTSRTFYFMWEIPGYIETDNKPITLFFNVKNKEYKLIIRN
jgi:hypothetical protein